MVIKRSPGGSVYPYYYMGGELFGIQLGGQGRNEEGAIQYLRAEFEFLKAQHSRISFWMDFHQTKLTGKLISEILRNVDSIEGQIGKLAIVGCSALDQWRLDRQLKRRPFPVKYYSDPENAKKWLVGKGK